MKIEVNKKKRNDFEKKNLLKFMRNSVFRKTLENVRKHRYLNL